MDDAKRDSLRWTIQSLREILNRYRWQWNALERLQLVVRHRGATGDVQVLCGEDILEIGANGVSVLVDPDNERWARETPPTTETLTLPYHRVLAVRADGGVAWSKVSDGSDGQAIVVRCRTCDTQVSKPVCRLSEWQPQAGDVQPLPAGSFWRFVGDDILISSVDLLVVSEAQFDHSTDPDGQRPVACESGHALGIETAWQRVVRLCHNSIRLGYA